MSARMAGTRRSSRKRRSSSGGVGSSRTTCSDMSPFPPFGKRRRERAPRLRRTEAPSRRPPGARRASGAPLENPRAPHVHPGSPAPPTEVPMTAALALQNLSLQDALDLAILIEEEAKDRYDEFTRIVGGRYAG